MILAVNGRLAAWLARRPIWMVGKENDEMTVLNSKLQVKGIDNLRVFDVSMMPNIVSANTNAPAMAIANNATDMLLNS